MLSKSISKYPLWRYPNFRSFTVVLTIYYLMNWMSIGALPVLVGLKFGVGLELVLSLGLRIAPRVLFSPLNVFLVRLFGPRLIAAAGLLVAAILTLTLPFVGSLLAFQVLVVAIGIADVAVTPSLLALRAAVTKPGYNLSANSIFQSIDRLSKIIGPAFAAMALAGVGVLLTYATMAGMAVAAAALMIRFGPRDPEKRTVEKTQTDDGLCQVIGDFARDPIIWAIVAPAACFMITLGAMQPFLVWLNARTLGGDPEMWAILLSAQGGGALLGALISGFGARWLERHISLLTIYLWASLIEGLIHLLLVWATSHTVAISILVLGGIPEMVAYVTYFALIQNRVPAGRQAVFYGLSVPVMDLFLVVGAAMAGLHANGMLSLQSFWLIAVSFSILPVLPWLLLIPASKSR